MKAVALLGKEIWAIRTRPRKSADEFWNISKSDENKHEGMQEPEALQQGALINHKRYLRTKKK